MRAAMRSGRAMSAAPHRATAAAAPVDDPILQSETDRRQLQQIIRGLTEGVILVEPDHRILWANDAALQMHGVKTVADLGRDVTEYRERFRLRYRNNHLLEDGESPIERVLSGEQFADVVVEVFPAHDASVNWVHRVRSLILTDRNGHPDCLALILHDASDWADAEERFERTFNANPAPALICRLSDHRYIKVNRGFLDMTGYSHDDVVGKLIYQLDVFEAAEHRESAVRKLADGVTIPQMESHIRVPGGASKPIVVAGQPIEIAEQKCMLFTFVDLEPRRRAEATMQQSDDRFSKAFDMLPVPVAVLRAGSFVLLDANQAFVAATGYAATEVVGRAATDFGLWDDKDCAVMTARLKDGGSVRAMECRIGRKDAEPIDSLVSAESVSMNGERCVLLAWLDITTRKRSETEFVSAIEEAMKDTTWFSRSLLEKLANAKSVGKQGRVAVFNDLTRRERDVFDQLCQGRSDKEIAKDLRLALGTIRNHVAAIYAKLDVHSRGGVILWARQHGYFATTS